MGFPASFSSTTIVTPPDPAAPVACVLDFLEQALQEYEADITHRGDRDLEVEETLAAMRDVRLVLLKGLFEEIENARDWRGRIGRRDYCGRRETGRKPHAVPPPSGMRLSCGAD